MHNRLQGADDTFFTNFSRTELTIGESRANNCKEVDFEVRFSLEAPKLSQKGEKRFPRPKNHVGKKFVSPKIDSTGIV